MVHANLQNMARLLLCGFLLPGAGCMTIYGSRTYVSQKFQLVDEKTGAPIRDAKLTVMATHGPEILPSLHLFRPKRAVGVTDDRGCVSLDIPRGSDIELLALAEKNGRYVFHGWDRYWPPDEPGKVRVLAGDRDSTVSASH